MQFSSQEISLYDTPAGLAGTGRALSKGIKWIEMREQPERESVNQATRK
jgi:hypothetical protein